MTFEHADALGAVAGVLTTAAFVPQVLKTWKSRSAGDVSFAMFFIFSIGVLLWLVYGILIGATPIVVANAITLVLAVAILAMKIRFK